MSDNQDEWMRVKQELIDELSQIKKNVRKDLISKTIKIVESLSTGQIKPETDKVSVIFETNDNKEAIIGQKYFDEAFKIINNQQFINSNT